MLSRCTKHLARPHVPSIRRAGEEASTRRWAATILCLSRRRGHVWIGRGTVRRTVPGVRRSPPLRASGPDACGSRALSPSLPPGRTRAPGVGGVRVREASVGHVPRRRWRSAGGKGGSRPGSLASRALLPTLLSPSVQRDHLFPRTGVLANRDVARRGRPIAQVPAMRLAQGDELRPRRTLHRSPLLGRLARADCGASLLPLPAPSPWGPPRDAAASILLCWSLSGTWPKFHGGARRCTCTEHSPGMEWTCRIRCFLPTPFSTPFVTPPCPVSGPGALIARDGPEGGECNRT